MYTLADLLQQSPGKVKWPEKDQFQLMEQKVQGKQSRDNIGTRNRLLNYHFTSKISAAVASSTTGKEELKLFLMMWVLAQSYNCSQRK